MTTFSQPRIALVFILLAVAAPMSSALEQGYDLVILNGRVMDPESGFDAVANVGVSDGWISAITEEAIKGAREIDASGHVVTAGFIDAHFHWTRLMGYKLALRDGISAVGSVAAVAIWQEEKFCA